MGQPVTEPTLGNSIDKGLNRVPRDGPPTYAYKPMCNTTCGSNIYQNNSLGRTARSRLGPGGEGRRLQTHDAIDEGL